MAVRIAYTRLTKQQLVAVRKRVARLRFGIKISVIDHGEVCEVGTRWGVSYHDKYRQVEATVDYFTFAALGLNLATLSRAMRIIIAEERENNPKSFDLRLFLTVSAYVIRKHGWLSRSKAKGGIPTVTHILDLLNKPNLKATAADIEAADWTIKWLKNSSPEVSLKDAGILASAIPAAMAAKGHKDCSDRVHSGHYGEVGKRERGIPATCTRVRKANSNYAYEDTTTMVAFEVGDKELLWFATGDKSNDWVVGTKYKIDATILEHKNDPRWGQSTIINRVLSLKSA